MTTYHCPTCASTLTAILIPVPAVGTQRTAYTCSTCRHRCRRNSTHRLAWTELSGWKCCECASYDGTIARPREEEHPV